MKTKNIYKLQEPEYPENLHASIMHAVRNHELKASELPSAKSSFSPAWWFASGAVAALSTIFLLSFLQTSPSITPPSQNSLQSAMIEEELPPVLEKSPEEVTEEEVAEFLKQLKEYNKRHPANQIQEIKIPIKAVIDK
ncbi:MAG: hypothetical protein GX221_10760 [Candidatus Riflebacteria bacterium]|nr:hypothetical protein [Candidatus Riflebacteria bacterium]